MVAKCQTSLSEFLNNDFRWGLSRPNKYSFGEALCDLSGVGAVYNLGSDVALLQRNKRMAAWIRGADSKQSPRVLRLINNSAQFFDSQNSSLYRSLISKVAYLGTFTAALAGYYFSRPLVQNTGLAGSLVLGTYFMGKAGFHAVNSSVEERGQYLVSERRNLAFQLKCGGV